MQLKIATTTNDLIFEASIEQVMLPGENGAVSLYGKTIPAIIKLVPGIIEIRDALGKIHTFSISKGIALVDGTSIKVTVSMLTESPLAKLVELRGNQHLLELKLQKLKTFGSIEEINLLISDLEKVKADIRLSQMKV